LSVTDLKKLGTGRFVDASLGASALGFNAFEQIGRVGGTFTGVIKKTKTGFEAIGIYTPSQDLYDFNNDPSRGKPANIVASVGRIGGKIAHIGSIGIIDPTNYSIGFTGNVVVDQKW
jgi:hypothetical protein